MKLKNLFLSAIAVMGLFSACSEKEEELGPAGITADVTEIDFPATATSVNVNLTATRDWTYSIAYDSESTDKWISISPASGTASNKAQKLEVTALANSGYNRTATITFTIGLADAIVTVTQVGEKGEHGALTVSEFVATNADEKTVYTVKGTASSNYSSSYNYIYITDGTKECEIYQPTNGAEWASKLKKGATITATGVHKIYSKSDGTTIEELASGEIIDVDESTIIVDDYTKAEAVTVADFISKADADKYYKLTGTVSSFSSTYCSFDLTDATGKIYVYSVDNKSDWTDKISNGGTVTLAGKYLYYSTKSQHEVVNAQILSFTAGSSDPGSTSTYEGLVVAVSSKAFLVKTSTGYAYAYNSSAAPTVKIGDNVKVTGTDSDYNGLPEVTDYTVTVVSSGNTVTYPTVTKLEGTALDSFATMFGYVTFSGKLTISGNYYNVAVNGATRVGSISSPVDVDASLNGKIVDVTGYYIGITGSSTSYFNVIATSVKASSDQSGADSGSGSGDSGASASLTPGENEVLYQLTNEEVVACLSATGVTSDVYSTVSISSKSGTWTANIDGKNTLKYLQFRNKSGSYIKSPEFASDVKRVVLVVNSTTVASRPVYAVPASTTVPTSSDKYTSDLWATNYGSVTPTGKIAENVQITFNGSAKSFLLIAGSGAVYIDAIYVFCAK